MVATVASSPRSTMLHALVPNTATLSACGHSEPGDLVDAGQSGGVVRAEHEVPQALGHADDSRRVVPVQRGRGRGVRVEAPAESPIAATAHGIHRWGGGVVAVGASVDTGRSDTVVVIPPR